jgi:predicted RNA polymerase sigma factor
VARDGRQRPLNLPAGVEDLLRELAPQVLGALARRSGDFDAAEDAVQDALLAAAEHWPRDGVPPNPRGWLLRTAGLRLIDHRRSETSRRQREELTAVMEPPAAEISDRDDSLIVLFMCCHPALTPASAIALTLRAAGGLTTAQVANAFLVTEATMAQRISRAKQRIRASGVPFRMPTAEEQPAAVRTVLRVLYLIFNEGYTSSSGSELQRTDLSGEAIRLARMVHGMLPEDPEVTGLLALMLLIDARRPARTDERGDPIPLADQDRTLWEGPLIAEGVALLDTAVAKGKVGEYQIQAAIAAIHDQTRRASDTDWQQIVALFGLLERMTANPIVTLNRAVAAAMAHGPSAGLAMLDRVEERLTGHYRLDVVRAHLLEMAGDTEAAVAAYRRAARGTTSLPEQRYLTKRAARLRTPR